MKNFAGVAKPKPEMLAMTDPITGVCDYHPDICASIEFWNQFEEESRNLAKTQVALQIGYLLVEGLKIERQTRPFSHPGTERIRKTRRMLLGAHIATKFMEETGLQMGENSVNLREYAELQRQDESELLPTIAFDLLDTAVPRIHLSAADFRAQKTAGLSAPNEGGRPRWFKKNELYVQTKYPAEITPDFLQMYDAQGVTLDPKQHVTVFPMLERRSVLGVDHRCTVPAIPILLRIPTPPELGPSS